MTLSVHHNKMRLILFAVPLLMFATQGAFASVDTLLLGMAPPSSTVLVGIDVARAESSPSGRYMLKQIVEDEDVASLLSVAGLNLRQDAREILMVGIGHQPSSDWPHAIIAEGTFDAARSIAAGRSHGASLRQYGGVFVLVQRSGNSDTGMAFLRGGFVVMGDLPTLYAMIAGGTHRGVMDPALREQANRIATSNDIWYATLLSGSFLSEQIGDSLPAQLRSSDFLGKISRSSGGLQLGRQDRLQVVLVASSSGDAQLLSGLLRLGGGFAKLQLGGDADLVLAEGVLGAAQVSLDGSTVRLTSEVPDSQLERALY